MGLLNLTLVVLVTSVMCLYLAVCPFNKVEESFNTQAMHDLWFHGLNLTNYDHFEYPGVVPRTFLGPIMIVLSASPLLSALDIMEETRLTYQLACRLVLGIYVAFSLMKIANAMQQSNATKVFFALLNASSFYYMFYATRTLPNIFALIFVQLAIASWLGSDLRAFLRRAGVAICVFRVEAALLLGPLYLISLLNARTCSRVMRLLFVTALYGGFIIVVNVAVDSYFWSPPGEFILMWPEFNVFKFNTIENKSHLWGTKPFLWYFYNVIPRFCLASLVLLPLAFVSKLVLNIPSFLVKQSDQPAIAKKPSSDETPAKSAYMVLSFDSSISARFDERTKFLVVAAFLFVIVYSFLPHKELRFIIYVVPIFNRLLSIVCTRLWYVKVSFNRDLARDLVAEPLDADQVAKLAKRHVEGEQRIELDDERDEERIKKARPPRMHEPFATRSVRMLLRGIVIGVLLINFTYSLASLCVSASNYPGGVAMLRLHELVAHRRIQNTEQFDRVNVHIDVYCAQSGISRFTQLHNDWRFDKNETLNVTNDANAFDSFTHLLVGIDDAEKDGSLSVLLQHFDVVSTINGFHSVRLPVSSEDRAKLLNGLRSLSFWNVVDTVVIQRPKVYILQNKNLSLI